MNSLTHYPPSSLRFEDVKVCIDRVSDGVAFLGRTPTYHFRIEDESGDKVGFIDFRVGNEEQLLTSAGHIGYGIKEASRGNGYALKGVKAIESFVKKVKDEVFINISTNNDSSRRVIEQLGGEFVDDVRVKHNNPYAELGARQVSRYLWKPRS